MKTQTYNPVEIIGSNRPSRWCVTCDHASNTVPDFVNGGDLGLSRSDMNRHIAYDIGAAGVARALAASLNGPAVLSNFSRLVIDPNRGLDDPTLVMRLYDGTVIPANRAATQKDIKSRISHLYQPYHTAVSQIAARPQSILVSIHSFTPRLKGRAARPWHIGVLYADDTRLAHPFLARLRQENDLVVGDNEPYTGRLRGDAMDQHALQQARPHVLIEIRNDLIATPNDQKHWADRLAPILDETLESTNL